MFSERERGTQLCNAAAASHSKRWEGQDTSPTLPTPPLWADSGPCCKLSLDALGGLSNDCSCTSHCCSCCQGIPQLPPTLQSPLQGLPLALQSSTVSKGTQDKTVEPEGQNKLAFGSHPSSFLQLPFGFKDGGAPHGEHRTGDHHNQTSPTVFLILCALECWCSVNSLQCAVIKWKITFKSYDKYPLKHDNDKYWRN